MKPALVTIGSKVGRLGNRLTQFANFIAFSEANQVPIANMAFDEYASDFEGTAQTLLCNYPPDLDISTHKMTLALLQIYRDFLNGVVDFFGKSYPELPNIINNLKKDNIKDLNANTLQMFRKTLTLMTFEFEERLKKNLLEAQSIEMITTKNDEDLFLLDDPKFIASCNQEKIFVCNGWLFRDPTNLYKTQKKIRDFFKPVLSHQEKINAHIDRCRQGVMRLIGVHIRQGDMREYAGGKNYFSTPKYVELMHRVKALFPNDAIRFLVCSDEDQSPDLFQGLDVIFGIGNAIEDLYCLAKCDHILAISSTFAAWAAFMGEAQVYSFEQIEAPIELRAGKILAK